MEQVGKEQAISNFSWGYMGKMGAQIISFGVTIVLARLIAPADFGLVAIVCHLYYILECICRQWFR